LKHVHLEVSGLRGSFERICHSPVIPQSIDPSAFRTRRSRKYAPILKTRASVGSEGASGSHRRLILVEIWWAILGHWSNAEKNLWRREIRRFISISLEDTCLDYCHSAVTRERTPCLSHTPRASLENASSGLAQISLAFTRDSIRRYK
jgi:hypothetical protein